LGYEKHDVVGGDGDRERWRRLGERRKKFKGRGRADSPPPQLWPQISCSLMLGIHPYL